MYITRYHESVAVKKENEYMYQPLQQQLTGARRKNVEPPRSSGLRADEFFASGVYLYTRALARLVSFPWEARAARATLRIGRAKGEKERKKSGRKRLYLRERRARKIEEDEATAQPTDAGRRENDGDTCGNSCGASVREKRVRRFESRTRG